VGRLRPELWRLKNWQLHYDNAPSHNSFVPAIFYENNIIVVPHPPYFSLLPQLKIKLKGRHFDTTTVIEAETQAVLKNTTCKIRLENGRSARNGEYARKGTTLRVMVGGKLKVSF
jgi:hypothetical protein